MMEPGFYLMDCMEAMKEFQDGFFDIAIVDPVYGDVTKGGYMLHNRGQHIGKGSANSKGYHDGLWNQRKTGAEYFFELQRVSYNQIIWGAITSLIYCPLHKVGLYGINSIKQIEHLQIANSHGQASIRPQGRFGICGMVCYKAT